MDEIDYDGNSELVAKLAEQASAFLEELHGDQAANVMRNNMDRIAVIIRDQLMKHAHYEGGGYEFKVIPGCQPLGLSSALIGETDQFRDFAVSIKPGERGKISPEGGFREVVCRCRLGVPAPRGVHRHSEGRPESRGFGRAGRPSRDRGVVREAHPGVPRGAGRVLVPGATA